MTFYNEKAVEYITNDNTGVIEVPVSLKGHICEDNSTSTPLPIDGVFEGAWQDTIDYGTISVGICTDQDSATDGLQVLWSSDGVNTCDKDVFTILADKGKIFTFGPARRYVKIIFTNNGVEQVELDIETRLSRVYFKPSSHRIQDSIVAEDDAELIKSVLTGSDSNGVFRNIKSTDEGILLTSDYLLEVSKNKISGQNIMNKFGGNPSIGTGTDPEDVWDGGGLYSFFPATAQAMEMISDDANDSGVVLSSGTATGGSATSLEDTGATFISDGVTVGDLLINDDNHEFAVITVVDSETEVTTSSMTNRSQESPLSSPNAAGENYRIANANDTGAATVVVSGLDSNWEFQNEVVVLNGTTAVDLANTYIRMNRMSVITAGTTGGAEGTIVCRIDGAGTTAAVIDNGNNQTLMAVYTIPNGRTGYLLQGYVALSKGGGAQAVGAAFSWRSRPYLGVFNINGVMQLNSSGSGWWQYKYAGAPGLPERTDILIRCDEVSATLGVVGGLDILLIDN